MRSMKLAACGVALVTGLGFIAAANAAETASLKTCLDMASQVKTALAGNENAAKYEEAKKEQNYGRDFCTNSFYERGVAHYALALKLLGVSDKS